MGGTMSQVDWVALPVVLIAYFYELALAGRWTDAFSRVRYQQWRRVLNSWIAFPGWVWQPMLFVVQALAASATFLYWRNSFPVDKTVHRDAVLGLILTNIFFLKMWTPTLLWGPYYWWMAALNSFMVMATSVAALAIIGVEKAWLPFGLYIPYVIFAFVVMIVTLYFYWNATYVEERLRSIAPRMRGRMGEMSRMQSATFEALTGASRVPVAQPRKVPMRQYSY